MSTQGKHVWDPTGVWDAGDIGVYKGIYRDIGNRFIRLHLSNALPTMKKKRVEETGGFINSMAY